MNIKLSQSTASVPVESLDILVLSDAAPSRNGVGAYYQDLLEHLAKRVHSIRLVSPTITNGKWDAGLVLPLPGDKTQKLCLPNLWKLNRLINDIRPDIVVIATPGVYGLTGAYLANCKKIPFLTGLHTSFEQLTELYWPNSVRGKIVEKYFLYSNGYLLKRTEAVLGNSEPILNQARAMGARHVRLIGTPVSSEFANTPIVPCTGGFDKLLFAGRLAKEKNIEAILKAAESLPELQFSLAGDGPLRRKVEKAAQCCPNVKYLGWLSRKALREAVDSHDALLLPSHFETFGTIALEAMARQRLVIVSQGCGITRWNELEPGLIVIPEHSTLVETLKMLQQKTPEERLGTALKAFAAANDVNRAVVDSWCRIFLDTLAARE